VVIYVTGNGLKTVEALAGSVGPSATISPTLQAVAELIDTEGHMRESKP